MAQQILQVLVTDHTGNTSSEVRITGSTMVAKLLPQLVNKLGLPLLDAGGRIVTYNLSYKNRRLREEETLEGAGVSNGDRIYIVPEMTAGGAREQSLFRRVSISQQ